MYESKISQPSLSVVSLTEGTIDYTLGSTSLLVVSAPAALRESIHVTAMAIPLSTYYRMDATILPGRSLHWPLAEVIWSKELQSRWLGIVGTLPERKEPTLTPLVVAQANAAVPMERLPVRLIARSNVDLESLHWRFREVKSGQCGKASDWQQAARKVNAGDPIYVSLPNDAGERCLELTARKRHSDSTIPLSYRILFRQ